MKPQALQSLIRIVSSRRGVVEEQPAWSGWSASWTVEAPVTGLELQKVQCNEVAAKVRGTYRRAARQTRSGVAGYRQVHVC